MVFLRGVLCGFAFSKLGWGYVNLPLGGWGLSTFLDPYEHTLGPPTSNMSDPIMHVMLPIIDYLQFWFKLIHVLEICVKNKL